MRAYGELLSKHSELIAGTAAISGAVLAFVLCIGLKGLALYVKPGESTLIWLIFSISSAIYYFVRSKGTSMTGGYTNVLIKIGINAAFLLPYVGLLLSVLQANFILQSGLWQSLIGKALGFLNTIIVFFFFASFGGGINSLKAYFFRAVRKPGSSKGL